MSGSRVRLANQNGDCRIQIVDRDELDFVVPREEIRKLDRDPTYIIKLDGLEVGHNPDTDQFTFRAGDATVLVGTERFQKWTQG